MSKPEPTIDGAKVLYWAWSGVKPFGWLGTKVGQKAIPIYGLAIAQYDNDSIIYRFSCNINWETEQDGTYETPEEAIRYLPEQYQEVSANWERY